MRRKVVFPLPESLAQSISDRHYGVISGDCSSVTIQNPFLTEDEIGHSRIGRSEDDVSSAF